MISIFGFFEAESIQASFYIQFAIFIAALANAFLLYKYWRSAQDLAKASLKQANAAETQASASKEQVWRSEDQVKASNELVKDSKREFEPSVQIIYKELSEFFSGYTFKGILLKNRIELHFKIVLNNLSKGITVFKVAYNDTVATELNIQCGIKPKLDFGGLSLNPFGYYLLKPHESLEVPVFVKIIETEDQNLSEINNFRGGYINIQYNIVYKTETECPENYEESWFLEFKNIRGLAKNEYLLVGDWKGPFRHLVL